MGISISKNKLEIVENELRENWKEYRELSLEEIRAKLISKLRQENKNRNEQLSHKEFYDIIKIIMAENKNKDKKEKDDNKKKLKKDIDNNDEER